MTKTPPIQENFSAAVQRRIYVDRVDNATSLSVRDLEIWLKSGARLVAPFSFDLLPGQRVLLTGVSGCGKSTLLKSLSGGKDWGKGRVIIPTAARMLHIPQSVYLPLFTLKGIVCYPNFAKNHNDETVVKALQDVGLARIAPHLNNAQLTGPDWEHEISGGQLQRLTSFARPLMYRPDFLLMDEPSSGLDAQAQEDMFALLIKSLPYAGIICISHHPEQVRHHFTHEAKIENGKWSMCSLQEAAPSAEPAPG